MPASPDSAGPVESAVESAAESPVAGPVGDGDAFADDDYRQAVIDLLGAIAYGEISAFERLAEDAKLAPSLEDKVAISGMAATEFGHLGMLTERLTELGADPFEAMAPFQQALDRFHDHTAPSDWF